MKKAMTVFLCALFYCGPMYAGPIASYDGTLYEIVVVWGSYNELAVRLQAQPWWYNYSPLPTFVEQVQPHFGFINNCLWGALACGPFYRTSIFGSFPHNGPNNMVATWNGSHQLWGDLPTDTPAWFAVTYSAEYDAPVSEPGTLSLLGLGLAGLGWSRQRRKKQASL